MAARDPCVFIVINALHSGGAEKSCIELCGYLAGRCDLHVIALLGGGPAEQELLASGVAVTLLQGNGLAGQMRAWARLAGLLRKHRPQTVITFLYLSDLFGGALARVCAPGAQVYWNIRNNLLSRTQIGSATYVASRLNALLSRAIPEAIVYCSPLARTQHESIGYRARHSAIAENSPASVPFAYDEAKRAAWRSGWAEQELAFLFVGRFDPVKRVDLFIEACAESYRRCGGPVRFQIAGRGMEADNTWLTQRIAATGIGERFVLLGHVSDRSALYSGADCLVVTSESEGSPNAVYEAMATGLQTLILATEGTEGIGDPLVRRIPTRSVSDLADAMVGVVRARAASICARSERRRAGGAPVEHPLVAYYRSVLTSATAGPA
jgi:glycosyltransferase involved in cell wall biosynthesis